MPTTPKRLNGNVISLASLVVTVLFATFAISGDSKAMAVALENRVTTIEDATKMQAYRLDTYEDLYKGHQEVLDKMTDRFQNIEKTLAVSNQINLALAKKIDELNRIAKESNNNAKGIAILDTKVEALEQRVRGSK